MMATYNPGAPAMDRLAMSDNVITAIVAFFGVIVTAVFTWLYQRKSATASLLTSFVDDAFDRQKRAEERLDSFETRQAELTARYEQAIGEIDRLRAAKHEMEGELQAIKLRHQDQIDQMNLQHEQQINQMNLQHEQQINQINLLHQAEIAEYETRMKELNGRVLNLERELDGYRQDRSNPTTGSSK